MSHDINPGDVFIYIDLNGSYAEYIVVGVTDNQISFSVQRDYLYAHVDSSQSFKTYMVRSTPLSQAFYPVANSIPPKLLCEKR